MSSLEAKKKPKTGIPVFKITLRNNDKIGESSTACSHAHASESVVEVENMKKQHQVQQQMQPQLSSCLSISLNPTKKMQCPETWADEVIESHSQKLINISVSDSKRRRDDMEKHLKEAEMQLVTMGDLLEQRDKMMKEAAEEADKKAADLELKLLTQDGHLIKHGIDPVTGEQIMLDEVGEQKVESSKKATKKKVQEMREKLKQMNNQADSYLSDIQNAMQFFNSLETASDMLGQFSDGDLEQLAKHHIVM